MSVLKYARSRVARSGASRSNYYTYKTVFGAKCKLEARSKIARSGATRSGYVTQYGFYFIGGADRTNRVIKGTTNVTFVLNQQKNTARFQVWGFDPTPGQSVMIASGSPNSYIFGGTVSRVSQKSIKKNQLNMYDVECVDYIWLLNRRRVTKQYVDETAAHVIVLDLLSNYSSGFTTVNIRSGSPTVGQISFRGTQLGTAIQKVCDQSGWHFYVDPNRDAHFYLSETLSQPTVLSPTTYSYEDLDYQLDLSQIRTLVNAVGGGAKTTAAVSAGASSIPVDECGWYAGGGGLAVSGSNIITYTGRSSSSGAGSLTGCSGIAYDLQVGDTVNVLAQVGDSAAQLALAVLEGGDGIHEDWIENGHWSLSAATANANSVLTSFKRTDVRGRYYTYDIATRVGRNVTIQLPRRNVNATVTIQRVSQTYVARAKWYYTVEYAVVWSDLVDMITGAVKPSIGG